ncbi:hypothetical protein [Mucilaginibacter sp.]|uniref:hypothetical protein n=1 Tax=Mucilaginibacter sp. TaxID=1882438 RepID=UPI00260BF3C8|nr:hypothetical protein [Mucilaginibacter sp.]MDB4919870.1 hypothetical protein [Mucilaginibacter sp.]
MSTTAGSFAQKVAGTWTVVYTLPAANAADGTLLYGAGLPASATGKNLDSYINTLTGIFYKKSLGSWSQVFSMATGPQGPQGTAGTNGANGTNGNTVLSGTINPSNSTTGVNGNFYINTSNYIIFGPKTAGVWGDGVSFLGAGVANSGAAGQVLVKVDGIDFNTDWQDNSFENLSGNPADNTSLAAVLATKQNSLGYIAENAASKNIANGYAGLDGSGKVAAAQLPGYVDDVSEFTNYAALPATGETGKIYITLNDNAEYRWSGSTYIQLVASPGSTDAVPEGSTNLYFTIARVLATVLTGLGFSSTTAITATDTILGALGKLQAQITALISKTIPSGGTTGQILAKNSGTNYDTGWVNPSSGGSGVATTIASGTDSYVATIVPAITTYENTQIFSIQFSNANTGAATLNLNGLGAKSIKKNSTATLLANDILASGIYLLAYDSTNFQIIGNVSGVLPTVTSGEKVITITSSGAQKNYDAIDQLTSPSNLTTADFSSGMASVIGLTGQYALDTDYRYDCIGVNQWIRSARAGNILDLYLSDIDDTTGDKTSIQLNAAYSSALPLQQVLGTNNLYIKKTSTLWFKIPIQTV